MKKIIFAAIMLNFVLFSRSAFAQSSLSDVSGHHNETAINYLLENNVVAGYDDETFRPDEPINRAEFTKIIIEAAFDADTINRCLRDEMQPGWTYTFFKDIDRYEWFAKYICVAKINHIVDGYPDGLFHPSDSINKAEAVKIITASQGYSIPDDGRPSLFSDVESSDWFAPYASVAKESNLLEDGDRSSFFPAKPVTRAAMSEMIYRSLNADNGVFAEPEEATTMDDTTMADSSEETDVTDVSESSETNEAVLNPVTTTDPSELETQLKSLILAFRAYDGNEANDSKFLTFLDTPEKNYAEFRVLSEKLSRDFKLEEDLADTASEEERQQVLDFDLITPYFTVRDALSLNENPAADEVTFYYDTTKSFVGIESKKNLDSTTDLYQFTCYPFVQIDGQWKLKLPTRFSGLSPYNFETTGVVTECAKEMDVFPVLTESDLTAVNWDSSASFSVRLILNGYLIENNNGGLYKIGYTKYLPLKAENNILEIKDIGLTSETFNYGAIYTADPNTVVDDPFAITASKGGLNLLDVEFKRNVLPKTFTF